MIESRQIHKRRFWLFPVALISLLVSVTGFLAVRRYFGGGHLAADLKPAPLLAAAAESAS